MLYPYVWWFNYNIKLPFNTDIRLMINNFFLNAKAYSTFAAQFLLGNVPSNRKCDSALFNRVGVPPGFGDWSVRLLTHVVYFILCYSAAKHEVRRLYLLNLRFYFFFYKIRGFSLLMLFFSCHCPESVLMLIYVGYIIF